jgi:hypothetical protein
MIDTLLSRQTKYIIINNPSLKIYKQLQKTHSTSLKCPCSTSATPYQNFLITLTVIHQICSSDFVSRQWINALFISDASHYSAIDFRTTANSQVFEKTSINFFVNICL